MVFFCVCWGEGGSYVFTCSLCFANVFSNILDRTHGQLERTLKEFVFFFSFEQFFFFLRNRFCADFFFFFEAKVLSDEKTHAPRSNWTGPKLPSMTEKPLQWQPTSVLSSSSPSGGDARRPFRKLPNG